MLTQAAPGTVCLIKIRNLAFYTLRQAFDLLTTNLSSCLPFLFSQCYLYLVHFNFNQSIYFLSAIPQLCSRLRICAVEPGVGFQIFGTNFANLCHLTFRVPARGLLVQTSFRFNDIWLGHIYLVLCLKPSIHGSRITFLH